MRRLKLRHSVSAGSMHGGEGLDRRLACKAHFRRAAVAGRDSYLHGAARLWHGHGTGGPPGSSPSPKRDPAAAPPPESRHRRFTRGQREPLHPQNPQLNP